MNKLTNILIITLTAAMIFGFSAAGVLLPARFYSAEERRVLAQRPDLSAASGDLAGFTADYEAYTLDQFPLRSRMRRIKAVVGRKIFRRMDYNGYYLADGPAGGSLSRLDYPLNEEALAETAAFLGQVYDRFLAGTDCRAYLSIIPDKNVYLAGPNGYPAPDYIKMIETVREALPEAAYLDLFPHLSAEDYYRTDPHWRQERLTGIALRLAEGMGADASAEYEIVTSDTPFYGAYYGQALIDLPPDELCRLTNDALEACTVTSYDTGKPKTVPLYDPEKAAGRDPYEMFLNGSDALLTVENPAGPEGRELVIFRDSFGSSLAPLFVPGYAKITLVDLRYLRPDDLPRYLTFEEQDVLFLYSTLILNSGLFRTAG